MYARASAISPSRGGFVKSRSASSISRRNRDGYRGEPSKSRPEASERYNFFSARVMATKHNRRSSSISSLVRMRPDGKMPSFMPHKNTYGNSKPLAACTVIKRTLSLPELMSAPLYSAAFVKNCSAVLSSPQVVSNSCTACFNSARLSNRSELPSVRSMVS